MGYPIDELSADAREILDDIINQLCDGISSYIDEANYDATYCVEMCKKSTNQLVATLIDGPDGRTNQKLCECTVETLCKKVSAKMKKYPLEKFEQCDKQKLYLIFMVRLDKFIESAIHAAIDAGTIPTACCYTDCY